LYVGRAQEKSGVWRTQRRHNPATGGSYAWLVRSTAFINFCYFYCVDADFGPFFIPGLRFGDARVHALLQALLTYRLLPKWVHQP